MRVIKRSVLVIAVGGIGSISLMLIAGHRNNSIVLLTLFAIWVLAPFVGLALANMASRRWSRLTRVTLHSLILLVAVGSLAIYWNVSQAPRGSRIAFPFLVVPAGSWLLLIILIPGAALISCKLSAIGPFRWLIKAMAAVVMLIVLGIALLLGLLLLDHNRDTALPAPTGPFPVGRATYLWTDDVHTDAMAPQPNTKRELVAWVWYPAAAATPSKPVDDYMPAPWRTALEREIGVPLTQFLTRDLARVHGHSIPDADLSPEQHSYPVVFMRAGLSALTLDYSTLAEDLASHGYVVVGFDAPYRTFVTVLPNGTVITRTPQNNADAFSGIEQENLAGRLVQAWTADMTFALDQLERLNASDPSGRFVGRLDMQRVGVFGHSLGGATALQFCHDDSRCKAGIDVDGAPWGSVVRDGVTQPIMFLFSDHSTDAADPQEKQIEANFQSLFDRLARNRCYQITIRGANHFMFSDDGAALKSPLLVRALRMLGIVKIDGRRQIAITEHFIDAFFDVYLKGAPASELNSSPQYPEVEAATRPG